MPKSRSQQSGRLVISSCFGGYVEMTQESTILVVDDDPMNVALIQAMLKGEDYCISAVGSGEEALSLVEKNPPDLILLDVMMPGLDGYEVTVRIKKDPRLKIIPIILVTALNRSEDKVRGLKAGADDFLSKPLDRSELKVRVKALLQVKAYNEHLVNYQQELEVEVDRRTAEVRAELQRRKAAEAQLIQAQKMEAIGTLAGGIAHDFNNILSSMIGFTELSLLDIADNSPVHEHLQQVLAAGNRARDLVHQILAFSRQVEHRSKTVQVLPIVKETLKLLRATLPATIDLQQDLDSSSVIEADPTMIHQVLLNLCTNAAHAMEEQGGILRVVLRDVCLKPDGMDRPADLEPGNYFMLKVSDTGCGIVPEIKDRIFDPFFTTKEIGKGTGIGLAAVHGIIKSHGGSIQVDSRPGYGTMFEVLLPRIENPDADGAEDGPSIPTGTETLLFIDDEKSIVHIAQSLLEGLGYTVFADNNWQKALHLFESQPQQFDLVITDMTMPQMTGTVLAEKLRQIRDDIPIVLCTGYSTSLSQAQLSEIGIQALVTKPFFRHQIAETVRETLDRTQKGEKAGIDTAA